MPAEKQNTKPSVRDNNTPIAVEQLEDAIKILRLRRAGFSVYEIAEVSSLPVRKVRALMKSAMEELGLLKYEEAEALRQMENDRIDAMLTSIWERASQGSLAHISTVIKLMERRAKMLALDLKPEHEATGDNSIVLPEWALKPGAQLRPEVIQYIQEQRGEDDVEAMPELQVEESDDG